MVDWRDYTRKEYYKKTSLYHFWIPIITLAIIVALLSPATYVIIKEGSKVGMFWFGLIYLIILSIGIGFYMSAYHSSKKYKLRLSFENNTFKLLENEELKEEIKYSDVHSIVFDVGDSKCIFVYDSSALDIIIQKYEHFAQETKKMISQMSVVGCYSDFSQAASQVSAFGTIYNSDVELDDFYSKVKAIHIFNRNGFKEFLNSFGKPITFHKGGTGNLRGLMVLRLKE